MKEHLTNFVELKTQLNKQNETIVYLQKELTHHNKLFDSINAEIETHKSQKDSIKNKFDNIFEEIDNRVQLKNFQDIINKIDYNRTRDHENMKLELIEFKRQFENKFQILTQQNEDISSHHAYQSKQISSMDERLQINYNSLSDRISAFTKSFLELQISISNNEDVWKKLFEGFIINFSEQQNQVINSITSSNKKEFLKITLDLQQFKEKSIKLHQEEMNLKFHQIHDNLINEIQTICEKVTNHIIEDRVTEKSKSQDQEVQVDLMPVKMIYSTNIEKEKQITDQKQDVDISKRKTTQFAILQQINLEHIQELIEKSVFELINETLATSTVLKDQAMFIMEKQKQETFELLKLEINNQVKSVINTIEKRQKELKHVQKLREIQQIQQQLKEQITTNSQKISSPSTNAILPSKKNISNNIDNDFVSSDMLDSIDEIKAEIQILNELREEIDQKVQLSNVEIKQLGLKLDKYSTQLLKIKSDFVTETEYINSQIRLLFKEKDSNLRRMCSVSNLLAALTESIFVILSTQLQTINQESSYLKFQSFTEGVIFELTNDSNIEPTPINYRNNKYTVPELLKKTFFGNLDLWTYFFENESFPEIREFHPSVFFKQHINKENIAFYKNNLNTPMNISRTTGEFPRASQNTLSVRESRKSTLRIQKPQSQQVTKRERTSMTVYKFMQREKIRENQSANSKRQN